MLVPRQESCRHSILTEGQKSCHARLVATNLHVLSSYFDLLEQTLTEYDILSRGLDTSFGKHFISVTQFDYENMY